jgi:hypothetical protein
MTGTQGCQGICFLNSKNNFFDSVRRLVDLVAINRPVLIIGKVVIFWPKRSVYSSGLINKVNGSQSSGKFSFQQLYIVKVDLVYPNRQDAARNVTVRQSYIKTDIALVVFKGKKFMLPGKAVRVTVCIEIIGIKISAFNFVDNVLSTLCDSRIPSSGLRQNKYLGDLLRLQQAPARDYEQSLKPIGHTYYRSVGN